LTETSRRTLIPGGLLFAESGVCVAHFCDPRREPESPGLPSAGMCRSHSRRASESRRPPLTAKPSVDDREKTRVSSCTYGGPVPGTVVRPRADRLLRVTLTNSHEVVTSIHWHGIALCSEAGGGWDRPRSRAPRAAPSCGSSLPPTREPAASIRRSGVQLHRGPHVPRGVGKEESGHGADVDRQWQRASVGRRTAAEIDRAISTVAGIDVAESARPPSQHVELAPSGQMRPAA
jgi:hypothetical protein